MLYAHSESEAHSQILQLTILFCQPWKLIYMCIPSKTSTASRTGNTEQSFFLRQLGVQYPRDLAKERAMAHKTHDTQHGLQTRAYLLQIHSRASLLLSSLPSGQRGAKYLYL